MLGGTAGCAINLKGISGSIKLNGSNLNLWEVKSDVPFIQVEFEVLDITGKGAVTTTIGCELESMIVANIDENNPNEEVDPKTEDYLVRDKIVNEANVTKNNVKATTTLWPEPPVPTTTEEPVPTTTVAGNVITANSNFLPTDTYDAKVGEVVDVEYSFNANVFATQWKLNYDPTVLELVTTTNFMPQMTTGADYNAEVPGVVEGSASNLGLYNVTADAPFVGAQFKKIAEGDTTVTLILSVLETAELNEDGTINEDSQVRVVFNGQVAEEVTTVTDLKTVIKPASEVPTETTPVPTETTPVPTETTPVPTETTPVPTETTPATTVAPTTVDQEVPTQPATDKGSSTADTPKSTADTPNNNGGNGAVQTGDASMAIIILSVLVAGTAVMFVLRKREMF